MSGRIQTFGTALIGLSLIGLFFLAIATVSYSTVASVIAGDYLLAVAFALAWLFLAGIACVVVDGR